jgi:hypothetical protein
MTLPLPEVPDFSDKFKDTPISEMDKIIREITAKRNYDVEQINRSNRITIENADTWLKPQETSLKSEKIVTNIKSNNLNLSQQNNDRLKYLNSDENTLFQKNKNVSWGKNEEFKIPSLEEESNLDNNLDNNIFKKLKKVPSNLENITFTINEPDASLSLEERLLQIVKRIEAHDNKIDRILSLLNDREN